jgi:hypothetical protein
MNKQAIGEDERTAMAMAMDTGEQPKADGIRLP